MTNLTSLTTVGFSDTDLGIREPFAVGCPKLQTLNIDNSQYRFIDGGLYYWSSKEWLLRFYCPGVKNSVLNIPSWRAGVETACNLNENPYLKTLNLHENCSRFPSAVPQQLEAIHVAAGNTHAFSQDGVLFEKSSGGEYTSSVYPPGKRDKSFTVPDHVQRLFDSKSVPGNTAYSKKQHGRQHFVRIFVQHHFSEFKNGLFRRWLQSDLLCAVAFYGYFDCLLR